MNHFILIALDSIDINEKSFSAHMVATNRLNKKIWPLYSGTKNKNLISQGDQCLIYIGGHKKHRHHFLAITKIKDIQRGINVLDLPAEEAVLGFPVDLMTLTDIKVFKNPIAIKPLRKDLEFIRNKTFWGIHMQGGVRKIPKDDFRRILKFA